MPYRLDELMKLAGDIGLACRRTSDDRLDVTLFDDCVLVFMNMNLRDENDTLMGFDGTPWHTHDKIHFCIAPDTYVEHDELDVLTGLGAGYIVVASRYRNGTLDDRWLQHTKEPIELDYIQAGDEIRVFRLRERT